MGKTNRIRQAVGFGLSCLMLLGVGCYSARPERSMGTDERSVVLAEQIEAPGLDSRGIGDLRSAHGIGSGDPTRSRGGASGKVVESAPESLDGLVALALRSNPKLRSLAARVDAAWARAPQMGALPDPTVGANVFGHPIETAAGSQRANLTLAQRIPSLDRLDARQQQAALEASALHESFRAEKVKLSADVAVLYRQLQLVAKQIEINEANQKILESIIRVELVRTASAGSKTAANDTLRASVERGRLEEARLALEQRRNSLRARLNGLLNRSPGTPIGVSEEWPGQEELPGFEALQGLALLHQPELVAAHLRVKAEQWGVEVADLARVPEVTVSASWFFIEGNRPGSPIVEVGRDAWSIGAMINVPLCSGKYDAMRHEARARRAAAAFSVEGVRSKYDAWLEDWLEQARAAEQTIRLYDKTILPQARSALRADRKSFGAGNVDFDRLMADLRTLIDLEVNYHRAQAQRAIALARLEQGVGARLPVAPKMTQPEKDDGDEPEHLPEPEPKPKPERADSDG